ncbi:recombination-associated protein RdgC [Citrobacter sp. NCU1]|uniref:recombination-associated protein RdgC n=1 Tax=Citrobacter sp. NCU1 TaxID=2026683 RepID=UPI001390E2A7|nr:recombination-associated protein RdgC [Citrobacter sp. NCU1]NDO81469.1 recombination-associated protein RdgC [Citrobacter sp. NCU1]
MKSPFLKNVCIYTLSREFSLSREAFHEQLSHFAFSACGAHDMATSGWTNVTPETMVAEHEGSFLICYCNESKILPAHVVNEEVANRVSKVEATQGRKVRRAERLSLKDEALQALVPRAFTKFTHNYVWIDLNHQRVIVEAGSARAAENILALLRKTLGSLPVVPLMMENPIELTLTDWLKTNQTPTGFTFGTDAVLKAILEDGGALRVSKQELVSEEISTHLDAGKLVTTAGLRWQDRISFRLNDDMTIKAIHFADELRDQNDDIEREDIHSRLVADFILFKAEFTDMLRALTTALGGECER